MTVAYIINILWVEVFVCFVLIIVPLENVINLLEYVHNVKMGMHLEILLMKEYQLKEDIAKMIQRLV